MIPWFILLGLIALLLAVFAILPLRGNSAAIRVKTKKDELEDELNTVYAQIRELERQQEQGELDPQDYERFRLRDETRAAKILQSIESTVETPDTKPTRASLRSGIVLFTLTALILGGLSAFAVPPLEKLALRPAERELYDNQNELLKMAGELNEISKKNEALPEDKRLEFPLELLMKYGDVAWELERFEDAAKGYGSALRQFTDNAAKNPKNKPSEENIHALSRYGQILFFNGDNDQALTLLETAAKLGNAEAWLTIGNIRFSSKNDPQGAIAAWEEFQKINKDKAFGARIPDLIAAAKTRLREADPGAKLFAQSCAGCHGAEAQGLIGPNLKTSSRAKNPTFLKNQLANGSINKEMPAFKTIQGKDLENLIKFVTGLKP
jgi:mono/diheme cytochrome c family protein/cytochrome c-type biogenesis protein CcmH/NrfG